MFGHRKSVWQFIILTNDEKHKNYFLSYDTLSLQKVITDLKPSDCHINAISQIYILSIQKQRMYRLSVQQ